MAHSHLGCQSPRDYFTEQLLTILVCGALGFVGIQMYRTDMLVYILAPKFHIAVLLGSIGVLALVALRAVTVWREAGQLVPVDDAMMCQENHVHTAACNHLPGLPTGTTPDANLMDDHGHSHDMSWVFARMLILVFPIALFALGIPNSGFSMDWAKRNLKDDKSLSVDPKELEAWAKDPAAVELESTTQADGSKVRVIQPAPPNDKLKIREMVPLSGETRYGLVSDAGVTMSFNELNDAAFDADKRKSYTGQTAILQGKFSRLGDKEFTLFRLKMTCCGADAVMLKVRILSPQSVNNIADGQWVQIRGVIRFMKVPGQDRYTPVLVLGDIKDIDMNVKVANEYEF